MVIVDEGGLADAANRRQQIEAGEAFGRAEGADPFLHHRTWCVRQDLETEWEDEEREGPCVGTDFASQRSHLVVPRVDSLDALDRRFECVRRAAQIYWRMCSANFFSKLGADELVNGNTQLRGMVFEGFDNAAKNDCKLNLR